MIVAVAIKNKAGTIVTKPRPARHHEVLYLFDGDWEQGFLTSNGTFVNRVMAEQIARLTGQLTKPLIGSILTSEDLW